ncbi:MAG: hypothetical protein ACFFAO_07235 [Candidatus Hermodarchaeota archaeon]
MKRDNNSNGLILVCPVCGFSFKTFNEKTGKKMRKCPLCGYEFKQPDILPKATDDFNKKFF